MIRELLVEIVVRYAFKIHRQVLEVWQHCLEEEQAAGLVMPLEAPPPPPNRRDHDQ